MKIEITGDKEVIKALEGLGPKVERKVLGKAMRTGLRPLLEQAKAEAPVDTGKLRDSLVIRVAKSKKRGTVALEVRPNEKKFADGHYYPAQVEYGTEHTEPNPFLARAFEAGAEDARDVALGEIQKGIDDIVRNG